MAIIHLGRTLPDGSSDLPGNAVYVQSVNTGRTTQIAFPYLILHHEEFTWPPHVATGAGELLPHRFTHHHSKRNPITNPKLEWLVCSLLHLSSFELNRTPGNYPARCPMVFGLSSFAQGKSDCPACSFRTADRSIAKNVQQLN